MKKFDHNHYNSKLKEYARELRTESVSKAEKYIWKGLLSRKQTGAENDFYVSDPYTISLSTFLHLK